MTAEERRTGAAESEPPTTSPRWRACRPSERRGSGEKDWVMDHNEQRDNSGALFKRKGEKRSDRSPDYTGKATIGGVAYRISGWKKTTKAGETYLSLSLRPAE